MGKKKITAKKNFSKKNEVQKNFPAKISTHFSTISQTFSPLLSTLFLYCGSVGRIDSFVEPLNTLSIIFSFYCIETISSLNNYLKVILLQVVLNLK